MADSRRMYCQSCRQTFVTSDLERCSLCRAVGKLVDPDSPEALGERITRPAGQVEAAEAVAPVIADTALSVLMMWRALKLLFGAVFCFALAGAFLFLRELREDPRSLSFYNVLLAVVVGGVGVLLLVAGIHHLREVREIRRRRLSNPQA